MISVHANGAQLLPKPDRAITLHTGTVCQRRTREARGQRGPADRLDPPSQPCRPPGMPPGPRKTREPGRLRAACVCAPPSPVSARPFLPAPEPRGAHRPGRPDPACCSTGSAPCRSHGHLLREGVGRSNRHGEVPQSWGPGFKPGRGVF